MTDQIQKALEASLQKKRTTFLRLYFLSNENLLKIFAEARNPKAMPPFLPKLFDGIHTLDFATENLDILAMNLSKTRRSNLSSVKRSYRPGEKEEGVDGTPSRSAVASCQILGPLL
jgi:hypothetical protein